jgi:hypothetical protein
MYRYIQLCISIGANTTGCHKIYAGPWVCGNCWEYNVVRYLIFFFSLTLEIFTFQASLPHYWYPSSMSHLDTVVKRDRSQTWPSIITPLIPLDALGLSNTHHLFHPPNNQRNPFWRRPTKVVEIWPLGACQTWIPDMIYHVTPLITLGWLLCHISPINLSSTFWWLEST